MFRFWFDRRVRSAVWQAAILAAFLAAIAWLTANTLDNLARRGIQTGFGFLTRPARFPISEGFLAYEPTQTYLRAFAVGLLNTIYVSVLAIAAAMVIGFVIGLARRSLNPLVRGVAASFVEAMRNTPLVVQLLFWYAVLTIGLPSPRAALEPAPGLFLSLRGLFFPWPILSGWAIPAWIALAAVALSVGAAWFGRTAGRVPIPPPRVIALGGLGLAAASGWVVGASVSFDRPALQGFNFSGGATLTPEFMALML